MPYDLAIPGYEDAVEIGRGGFGVVYRARQPRFSRSVAINVLASAGVDRRVRGRFERECQALGNARAREGEVGAIYVRASHWDRGVGGALMAAALGELGHMGFSQATLWVLEGNARARQFYEEARWEADGQLKVETRPGGVELREVRYRIAL